MIGVDVSIDTISVRVGHFVASMQGTMTFNCPSVLNERVIYLYVIVVPRAVYLNDSVVY